MYVDSERVIADDHQVWRTTRELHVLCPVSMGYYDSAQCYSQLAGLFDELGVDVPEGARKDPLTLKGNGFDEVMRRLNMRAFDGVLQPVEGRYVLNLELVLSNRASIERAESDFDLRYFSWAGFRLETPLP